MPRTKQVTAKPASAKTAKPAKAVPAKKASTPKKTPSRVKKSLMRDLHSLSDNVEQRMAGVLKVCQSLAGLKGRVDTISANVEEAQKEHDERVGKVEREILNYQLAQVQEVLKETKKVVIDNFEMEALKKLQKEKESAADTETKTLDTEVAEKVAELVRFKEVEFQNKYAEFLAKQASMESEKRTLMATIASLRFEIESQKTLSSDIAKANQQKKINEMRRKAIEEMNAKEAAKEEALFRSQIGLMPTQNVAPIPAAAPAASTIPPVPKAPKKPVGKKATPSKKPPQPAPADSPSTESDDEEDEDVVSSNTEDDSPVKVTQETPKRKGSELSRQGSAIKKAKPGAKKAAKK